MESTQHLNIRVLGDVQGVNFRDNTQKKARAIGVAGFVRNEPDGTVYLEAESDRPTLDRFVDWLQNSPGVSKVDHVAADRDEVKFYTDFEVQE